MENTMRLQGIGWVNGIKASELQIGMRLMWNYGGTYDVMSITPKGKQSIKIIEKSTDTGNEYTRTLRLNRTVAAYWPKLTCTA